MEIGDWQCQTGKDKIRSHENKDKEKHPGEVLRLVQYVSVEA
jgi:hypothetical protein